MVEIYDFYHALFFNFKKILVLTKRTGNSLYKKMMSLEAGKDSALRSCSKICLLPSWRTTIPNTPPCRLQQEGMSQQGSWLASQALLTRKSCCFEIIPRFSIRSVPSAGPHAISRGALHVVLHPSPSGFQCSHPSRTGS